MMFLVTGYFNADKMNEKTDLEIDQIMATCEPYLQDLYASEQVLLDMGLEASMKQLKRESQEISITDGPVTASKEVMGSAFVIEAVDMEDAVRIASIHPTTQVPEAEALGWRLEIRPVHYYRERE
ncbi:YciI family protein [Exiguobacterium chiriqhucha]|uniref:YciI family protein n=1 Tax=Exiguobacterium chiriqhucha TaxID=1385984 RepID=UPI0004954045|nr:YciI family protein [Exiguobacterium chiriqhucha]